MSSWAATKYKTTNWSAYNDSLKRRGSLSIWFDPQMVWVPPPTGKRGRWQQFSDAAIQACLALKMLFGMPLRQTTGFVESLLKLVGFTAPRRDSIVEVIKALTAKVALRTFNMIDHCYWWFVAQRLGTEQFGRQVEEGKVSTD